MVIALDRITVAPRPGVAPADPVVPFELDVVSPPPDLVEVQASPGAVETAAPLTAPWVDVPETVAEPTNCVRCRARLVNIFDEPQCPVCGWADYSKIPERTRGTSLLSTATRFVIRYAGDSGTLSETVANVRVVRIRNRVAYEVSCPFLECQKTMEQTSLSGKRPEVREQRFRCTDGHRVSLLPGKGGMLGWK